MADQYKENLKRLMNKENSTPDGQDIMRFGDVSDGQFIPAASGHWGSSQPSTIGEALDKLAYAIASGSMP